jgi:hypothetical protein
MSQNPVNSASLIVKYLALFTALGLGAAVYFAATVSTLSATLVLVGFIETGAIFSGLILRQQRAAAIGQVVGARSVDLGLRKLPPEVAE